MVLEFVPGHSLEHKHFTLQSTINIINHTRILNSVDDLKTQKKAVRDDAGDKHSRNKPYSPKNTLYRPKKIEGNISDIKYLDYITKPLTILKLQ